MIANMLSLDQVRQQLAEAGIGSMSVSAPKMPLEVAEKHLLVKTDQGFRRLSRDAVSGLRRWTGLQASALNEFFDDAELTQAMIKHCLTKRQGSDLVVSYDRDAVLSISPSAGRLQPGQILDLVGNEFKSVEQVERFDRRPHLSFRFVSNQSIEPPRRPGDFSHSGVYVELNGRVRIASYVVRLVCSNGMMRQTISEGITVGKEAESFVRFFRDSLADAGRLASEFVALDNQRVDNAYATLTSQFRHLGVAHRFRTRVLESVPGLPEQPTAYDVVNLVTQIGREHRQLQWAAPRLVKSLADQHCSHCGATLVTPLINAPAPAETLAAQ